MRRIHLLLAALSLFTISSIALAFQDRKPEGNALSAETRKATLEQIGTELETRYVFPEVGKKMKEHLLELGKNGTLDQITSGDDLAKRLTDELQGISKDKHLRVGYSAERAPGQGNPAQRSISQDMRSQQLATNHGFMKLERLPGNIGYIDLRGFMDPSMGADTVKATFDFLANTDALIFDLRKNGGGMPTMIRLICSYLFDETPVHLNSIYSRLEDKTEEYWTLKTVPGKRYLNKDVYIVTSAFTFSGAEEFTYNLKNLKRATVVGETTGGGAHPVMRRPIGEHFSVMVPFARAINPITKTNWEGTGVTPDVQCSAEEAFDKAYQMAVEKLKASKDAAVSKRVTVDLEDTKRREQRIQELRERNLKDHGGK